MKSSTKIVSIILLVAFFGLLSLGTIVDKSASSSQHSNGIDPVRSNSVQQDVDSHAKRTSNGVDCFGAGCGPVEHVVIHDYLVVELVDGGEYTEFYHQNFADSDSIPQSPEISQESPPPKFFLV